LEVLSQLVDRSLVQAEESADLIRYRLLETMRQYASDRLVESGEAIAARDRHLAHYESDGAQMARREAELGEGRAMALVDLDYERAVALLEESVALALAADDRRTAAASLFFLGFHEGNHGHLDAAEEHLRESIGLHRPRVDGPEVARASCGLAMVSAM